MAYGDKVLDHFQNPRNVGSLDRKSENVGTGIVGAPECEPQAADNRSRRSSPPHARP